nr:MAG TPA: hypothetical protein [Caudoviricetes sp.]
MACCLPFLLKFFTSAPFLPPLCKSRRRHQKPKVDGLLSTFFVKIFYKCPLFAPSLQAKLKNEYLFE